MSVIERNVVRVVIDDKYRYEYLEDGSKKWKYIVYDEDRVIDPNEVKAYFNDDDFGLKTRKDEQGRKISSEYQLCDHYVTIDKNSVMLSLRRGRNKNIIFDDKKLEPIKDGYTAPVDFDGQQMIAEYSNDKFQGWFVRDKDTREITGRRDVKYYSNGKKRYDTIYQKFDDMDIYKQDIYYHENGNIAGMAISFSNKFGGGRVGNLFWEERYNLEGILTYRVMGHYYTGLEKTITCLEEYDETGKILHSIEPGDVGHAATYKDVEYDETGNPLIIRYKSAHHFDNGKILRIIDNNKRAYPNGRKKIELNADGSKTKFYETGEVLSQTDKDGKETFYYKDGKQRMVIEADGTKNVNYDGGQFLLISGRHCDKDSRGNLSEEGKKQAENIGKFIAYASQGKISGLPHVILPEVSSSLGEERVEETDKIILETINTTLQVDNKCEKVNDRYAIEECKHNANAELSIHSMNEGYDTADDKMGSIAFSVVGRDGFVIDRVVFTAEQIAEQLARVEEQEKLKQETKSKIEKFKEEALERAKATKESIRKAIDDSFRRR